MPEFGQIDVISMEFFGSNRRCFSRGDLEGAWREAAVFAHCYVCRSRKTQDNRSTIFNPDTHYRYSAHTHDFASISHVTKYIQLAYITHTTQVHAEFVPVEKNYMHLLLLLQFATVSTNFVLISDLKKTKSSHLSYYCQWKKKVICTTKHSSGFDSCQRLNKICQAFTVWDLAYNMG